jgi:hypothetical protein
VYSMAKKKTREKNYDDFVREITGELKRDKLDERANIASEEKQAKIGELTNVVDAKQSSLRRICEILTEKDFGGDKQRYIEFKNYCDEYDFSFYKLDKNGKRFKIDPATLGKKPREAESK